MIELRCNKVLHAKLDPDTLLLEIKCKDCSRAYKQPIFHRWRLADVIEQAHNGEVVGICGPTDPLMVHWRVKAG
jgi:hypothetical protein